MNRRALVAAIWILSLLAVGAGRTLVERRIDALLTYSNDVTPPVDLRPGTTMGGVALGGGGETNTASNLGGGLANYSTKVGADLRFNSFDAADFDLSGSNLFTIDATKWLTITAAAAAYQPLNAANLSAIAALTTTAFGRGVLDDADAAALRTTADAQQLDPDLTDLADGSLTGSKVGTGIAAGNITSGTVPDAQIAGSAEEDEIDLLDLLDTAAADACVGDEYVKRNAGDTAFECLAAPFMTSFTLFGDDAGPGSVVTDTNSVFVVGDASGIDTDDGDAVTDSVAISYDPTEAEAGNEGVIDLLDLKNASSVPCTPSQQVRWNAAGTSFECFTGSSGGGNGVDVTVDFGAETAFGAPSVVVTGQAWVSLSSKIVCQPTLMATADRSEGLEDALLDQVNVAVHSRVAATGFTVETASPVGAQGKFLIQCLGV